MISRYSFSLRRSLCVLIGTLALSSAYAQSDFPNKPIKMIVPFAAGGATDLVARVMAEGLRIELGQPVVVDNKGGAGGMLGTEAIANAPADGYTIGMATVSTMAVNPIFHPKAAATNKQLMPLMNLVSMPSVIVVNPAKMPVKDFNGLIAELKRKPGVYNSGYPGVGSLGHLIAESFVDIYDVKVTNVPYKGMGPALTDLLGGNIQYMLDQLPSSMPHITAGKLVPVVVSGNARQPNLPNVPTFKELGQSEMNDMSNSWFGLVVPGKTPDAVADRLRQAALKALKQADLLSHLSQMGASATPVDKAAFIAQIDAQLKRNQAIAKKFDIKPE